MIVIEKYNDSQHNPYWKYQLGQSVHEVKDTPSRVKTIKDALRQNDRFTFMRASHFPEWLISHIHPYHDYIKKTSATLADDEEIYPELFPGEGAYLPKRVDRPLWGGLWCADSVTPIMKKTYLVARASVETALTGADLLIQGNEQIVYALCRPSGHHAGPRIFGGYCYFNNVATAAQSLLPYGTVAILDIDYHHGNGTQEFFQKHKHVFTASIHADPSFEYPYFWGYSEETGTGQGVGSNMNIPLPRNTSAEEYLAAIDRCCVKIKEYEPDFLIIAAGFDTHGSDPIGGFQLQTSDFRHVAERLAALKRPTLICQEGGYNIAVLGECVRNFLEGFLPV